MSGDHNQYQADHIPAATKMIECATCGYPLTDEEKAGLVEINGKMHKPWVGLTDEEITKCWINKHNHDVGALYAFACAIETKLKEKNT